VRGTDVTGKRLACIGLASCGTDRTVKHWTPHQPTAPSRSDCLLVGYRCTRRSSTVARREIVGERFGESVVSERVVKAVVAECNESSHHGNNNAAAAEFAG
jgi:hypothetical protein